MDLQLDPASLRDAFLRLIILIVSFVIHEWGHAIMADRVGDDTPRIQGRVTLNPLAHIDLFGTIILPLLCSLGFFGRTILIGWAKPVITNPSNFRNGTRDAVWVTLAGPGMNLILATGATVAAAISARFAPHMAELFGMILDINVMLLVFNLLPIPPTDGSKFLMYWGGMSEQTFINFSRWSGLLFIVLLNIPLCRNLLSLLYLKARIPFEQLYTVLT